MCGDRELKGQAFRVFAKMPPTGGILFHEFGPRAPGSAWGLLEFIDHYPAAFKDLGRCLALPAAALRRLIVVIGVISSSTWRVSIWLL